MEWLDVVDENGLPTGEVVERKEAHTRGIRHRTAHIWIVRVRDHKVEVLLQKRAKNKDSFPGQYDTSSAGHIQASDEPLPSALRELEEELGICAQTNDLEYAGHFLIQYEKEFHGKCFIDNEYAYVYVYKKEIDIMKLILQKEEIESVAWFDFEMVCDACMNKKKERDPRFCVPSGGLRVVKQYVQSNVKEDMNS